MRDEKEERKKQARSNKQTRQSNTAHPRQSHIHIHVYLHGACGKINSHPQTPSNKPLHPNGRLTLKALGHDN